jgi:hypothetical protein
MPLATAGNARFDPRRQPLQVLDKAHNLAASVLFQFLQSRIN